MKVLSCTQVYLCCFWSYVLQKFISSFHLCFYYVQFQLYYDCFVLLYFGICLYQALILYTLNQSNFLLHKKFNVYSNQSGILLLAISFFCLLSEVELNICWIKSTYKGSSDIQSLSRNKNWELHLNQRPLEPSFRRETI